MRNFAFWGVMLVVLGLATGCNSTYIPPVDPNGSDLTPEQIKAISKRKIQVPCSITISCSDSFVGVRDSLFFNDYYHYPLRAILTNSFRHAAYQVFEPAQGEVIDAFNIYVTVQEANLDIAWGKANFVLQIIMRFDEPGEKKILSCSISKRAQVPLVSNDAVPDAVYMACRDAAFETMQKILENPRLWTTVKRFENR
jgi:hypothetical protein